MKILKAMFLLVGVLFLSLVAVGIFKRDFESQVAIEIDAPISQTFAVYNNPFMLNRWLTDFKSLEKVSGELNQVGSQWKLIFDTQNNEEVILRQTITQFEPEHIIAFGYDNIWLSGHNITRFEALASDKTQVTITQNYSGKGIVQNAMLFLMSHHVNNMNQQNLKQLKGLIEQSTPETLE
ncbi:MAG: SRPBCC domain-containing protein [Kangiellaceae bacterium]|nr:SRPBCC domain-containing protein [Kangiellaceae bacterium]